MRELTIAKKSNECLGEYKSIWNGVGDELKHDLIVQELRKDHRRSMKEIRRIAGIRYWIQQFRWAIEELRIFFPLLAGIFLGLLILFIISY